MKPQTQTVACVLHVESLLILKLTDSLAWISEGGTEFRSLRWAASEAAPPMLFHVVRKEIYNRLRREYRGPVVYAQYKHHQKALDTAGKKKTTGRFELQRTLMKLADRKVTSMLAAEYVAAAYPVINFNPQQEPYLTQFKRYRKRGSAAAILKLDVGESSVTASASLLASLSLINANIYEKKDSFELARAAYRTVLGLTTIPATLDIYTKFLISNSLLDSAERYITAKKSYDRVLESPVNFVASFYKPLASY